MTTRSCTCNKILAPVVWGLGCVDFLEKVDVLINFQVWLGIH